MSHQSLYLQGLILPLLFLPLKVRYGTKTSMQGECAFLIASNTVQNSKLLDYLWEISLFQ